MELRELACLRQAAISGGELICGPKVDVDGLPTLRERIAKIFNCVRATGLNPGKMTFFVMYDIASNKVRTLVAKYLERIGLARVQKSVFMGCADRKVYERLKDDLADVQAAYENSDSIIVIPVSADMAKSMRLIGRELDIDIITQSRNILII